MQQMRSAAGSAKTRPGLPQRVGKGADKRLALDRKTLEYRPAQKRSFRW
jgi:hypothetical protein